VPEGDWFATLGEYTVIGGRLVVASCAWSAADTAAATVTRRRNARATDLIEGDG
jgi:hypothetical protein